MAEHYIEVCRVCSVVVGQCRCPGPRVERQVTCPRCEAAGYVGSTFDVGDAAHESFLRVRDSSLPATSYSCGLLQGPGHNLGYFVLHAGEATSIIMPLNEAGLDALIGIFQKIRSDGFGAGGS